MDTREEFISAYKAVRDESVRMCAPLEPEDYQVQTMEEVSPPKWNLGHTSWFFAEFVLGPRGLAAPEDDAYRFYLNSYYHRAGKMGARGRRGRSPRPTTREMYEYRGSVDARMERLVSAATDKELEAMEFILTVGLNHEQQHQELFYTEIKNIYFACPPNLRPAYAEAAPINPPGGSPAGFVSIEGGISIFGNVEGGWCWDNELDAHPQYIGPFALMDRLVTNGEYLEFMEDGGYSNVLLWLSDGWAEKERQGWRAPLYWEDDGGAWRYFTLSGTREIDPAGPVCHVGFYEACAYAKWKGARLPTEYEWELAARRYADPSAGNMLEARALHPVPASGGPGRPAQMFGDAWEWTSSQYGPYPGFREFNGMVSEYNGKFMNNQRVLRGGSCVTPPGHIRTSYRNFWHPAARFQFTGIRLAKDIR